MMEELSFDDFNDIWYLISDDSSNEKNGGNSTETSTLAASEEYDLSHSDDDSNNKSITCKKKRIYNRRKRVLMPRIVKHDIRKLYSTMFANVVNMMDFGLLNAFFKCFCRKDLSFTCLLNEAEFAKINVGNNIRSIDTTGVEHSSLFVSNSLQVFPDLAVKLHSTEIHMTSASKTSYITANLVAKGSKLHDLPISEVSYVPGSSTSNQIAGAGSDTDSAVSADSSADNTVAGSFFPEQLAKFPIILDESIVTVDTNLSDGQRGKFLACSTEQMQVILDHSPMLEKPIEVELRCTLTMFLDEDKRVTRIIMDTT